MIPYLVERDLVDIIKLRILRLGNSLGLSGWILNAITCIPGTYKGSRGRSETDNGQRSSNGLWSRLEWCSHTPRNASSTKSWKRQGAESAPEQNLWGVGGGAGGGGRGHRPAETLIPAQQNWFWSPKLWENKLMLFEVTQFVAICNHRPRKAI